MTIEILMPALSPTMTEGNLSKWLVNKGDKVKAGDLIAEIETDKATMEVEAVDEGIVLDLLYNEGETNIPVNKPIAIIGDQNEKIEKKDNKQIEEIIEEKIVDKPEKENIKNEKENKIVKNTNDLDIEKTLTTDEITMRQAIRDTIAEEMRKDKKVFILGEEVAEYKQGGEGSWAPNELGALPSVLVEEGAMLHVKPVVEDLPEGTVLIGERLDDYNLVIQPKIGDSPHPSTVVNIGSEARRIAGNHVAVYPERLVNYFIQGSTDPGDVVLDPFMGTGTTAVVAKALGRHYYGFDISDDYVRTAMDRIESGPYLEELKKAEKTNSQKTLF